MSTPPKSTTDGIRDFPASLKGGLEHLASNSVEGEEQLIKTDENRDLYNTTSSTTTIAAHRNGTEKVSPLERGGEHTESWGNENEDHRQLKVRFPKRVRFLISEEPDIWQKEALFEEIDLLAGKVDLHMEETGRIVQDYEAKENEQQDALLNKRDPLAGRSELERVVTRGIDQSWQPVGNERGEAQPEKAVSSAEKAAFGSGEKRGSKQKEVHHCILAGHLFARAMLPEPGEKTRNKIEERHVKCERCRCKIMEPESYICEIAICGITACSKCVETWERERREKAKGSWTFV